MAGHQQVIDLHLVNLVAANGGVLTTFDRRIRAALAERDRRYVDEL